MKIGFIGLGDVGGKLAGSLLCSGFDLTVRDLNRDAAQPLRSAGAHWGESPAGMMEAADAVITCLPNPAASAAVLEAGDGLLSTMGVGTIWMEMSTTDEAEVRRLGEKVRALGGEPADCPVSGGCHRAIPSLRSPPVVRGTGVGPTGARTRFPRGTPPPGPRRRHPDRAV